MTDSPGRRILFLFQHAPTPGAPGMYRQRRYLAALAARGWRVDVVSTPVSYLTGEVPARYARRPYTREEIEGIRHHWVRAPGGIHASRVRRSLNYVAFAAAGGAVAAVLPRPDVVLASTPPLPVAVVGALVARRFRRPLVLEVRDLWPESAAAVGWLTAGSRAYRALEAAARFATAAASAVVVPSPGQVQAVLRHGARRVEVVTGAVRDTTAVPEARAAARRELGVGDRERLFVYVGALGVANGLDLLLDAVELLPADVPARFLLVGDGSARAALERRLEAAGLGRVSILPVAEPARVRELLAASDVCLHVLRPSDLFADVLPNKVLDYLGAHRPFLTTTPGVSARIARESGGGVAHTAAELAAEVRRWALLSDAELVARGERAFAYGSESFGFETNLERLVALLQKVSSRQV